MLVVNISAFGLYRLTGKFGPFHIAAIISLLSVLAGTLPLYYREQIKSWKVLRITFLYYSVIGLYADTFFKRSSSVFLVFGFGGVSRVPRF